MLPLLLLLLLLMLMLLSLLCEGETASYPECHKKSLCDADVTDRTRRSFPPLSCACVVVPKQRATKAEQLFPKMRECIVIP